MTTSMWWCGGGDIQQGQGGCKESGYFDVFKVYGDMEVNNDFEILNM